MSTTVTAVVVETHKERLERLWTRCGCGSSCERIGNTLVCCRCKKVVVKAVR